jgi:predicted nucleic acid-binding protein
MTVVIDASVAVKWVCDEPDSEQASALLSNETLVAPAFWIVEASNALWRRRRLGELTEKQTLARLDALHEAPVRALEDHRLVEAALRLANDLDHLVYDCLYLAAAIDLDTQVITADRRFEAAVGRRSALRGRLRML